MAGLFPWLAAVLQWRRVHTPVHMPVHTPVHPFSVEGAHLVLCTVFVIYSPITGWFPEATEEKAKLE